MYTCNLNEIHEMCVVNLKKWLLLLGFLSVLVQKLTIQRFCTRALNSGHRHSVNDKKVTRPYRQMLNLRLLAINPSNLMQ